MANVTIDGASVGGYSDAEAVAAVEAVDPLVTAGDLKIVGDVGFYNTAPVIQPTITGERAANPALADLIAELASQGLVIDSTTEGSGGGGGGITSIGVAMTEFVESGFASLHILGGSTNAVIDSTDRVDIGWRALSTGTSNITIGADMPGGIKLTVTTSGDDAGFQGSAFTGPSHDWVIGCRVKQTASAVSQDFFMGLKFDTAQFTATDINNVGFRLSGTGNYLGVTDDNGTESTRDTGNNDTSEHALRIECSGNGTVVKFFFDNVQVGADVITNITPSMDTGLACGLTGSDGADHSFWISDLYAYRGN